MVFPFTSRRSWPWIRRGIWIANSNARSKTIRLRIPEDAQPDTPIVCDDCGEYLGTWDEIQSDLENQGGTDGVFVLAKGRIQKIV
jgi:hypothetical protein